MYLFELAMELGERSADMAEAATSLGMDGVTPTTELTPDQVEAFRARFTKAPASIDPGGPAPYQPLGGAVTSSGAVPPPPVRSSGGVGAIQILLIGAAVVAVGFLFAFMFTNGGTDQQRLDEIAAATPGGADVPTVGPDGKPLTDEQKFNLAKMEAAQADRVVKACAVVQQINDADVAAGRAAKKSASLDEIVIELVRINTEAQPLFDEAIAVLPDQADGVRGLRQFSNDLTDSARGANDPAALRSARNDVEAQFARSDAYDATMRLDTYAQDNCGVSLTVN